jgi:deoxyhypusine synthase
LFCPGKDILNVHTVRSGIEAMVELAGWYGETSRHHPVGFFQIGGGIAGDFPICVVPMLRQDLRQENIPLWAYFCQISWGKLGEHTPAFMIESDATIVASLIFAKVLNW